MKTWTTQDKTGWGDGPWNDEPDKAQWISPTGLDCLIVRNPLGALCGYVGVPPGHRLHGIYPDEEALDVHGGITFASLCDEEAQEGHGICHIPEAGRPGEVWWIGFDCAHGGIDLLPNAPEIAHLLALGSVYKDFGYVQEQVEQLATQLARG